MFTGADCERIIRFAFDFKRVAADYPDVGTESVLAGAMSAEFVPHPEDLSVVVVSDLNPGRRFPSMFEPVHGSAPDIAGQGLANPVETVAGAGILTRDVGGNASTEDVTRPSSTR